MKLSIVSALSVATLALVFSGCNSTVKTNSNTAVVTNTANSNTAVNKSAETNKTIETNKPATNTTSDAGTGDVVKIDEAGVMMTVPKGFKYSKDGEDIIVKTEDEGVDIRFSVPKDGDYEKAIVDAATEIDDYLKDVKVEDKGSKTDVSGMEATSMDGTATNEGEPVMWNLTIINAPKKPVLVNIYAEKTSLEKHGADVKKFLESVKKQ